MFRHVAQKTLSRGGMRRIGMVQSLQKSAVRPSASLAREQVSAEIPNDVNQTSFLVNEHTRDQELYNTPPKIGTTGSLTVTTKSCVLVPVDIEHHLSIPLTLVDVHCREEQLPFAYFFKTSLSQTDLLSSLRRVLKSFPMLGGIIDWTELTIRVAPNEGSVNISFGESPGTAEEWARMGQHGLANGRSPSIMGLFDPLESREIDTPPPLATVRVTYLGCGGTVIGINLSHSLADASSCFRFVQCWSREMRGLKYPIPCVVGMNERSSATISGMTTPLHADLLNLSPSSTQSQKDSMFNVVRKMASTIILEWVKPMNFNNVISNENSKEKKNSLPDSIDSIPHEYVDLHFSLDVLRAMKAYGMTYLSDRRKDKRKWESSDSFESPTFVSTNDMIVAFGWLMKRHVSGRNDWQMSVVMNLRGRSGVRDFIPFDEAENDCDKSISPLCTGVFGNGIMNVIAMLPPTFSSPSKPLDQLDTNLAQSDMIDLDTVSEAALVVRSSIVKGLKEIPEKVTMSRLGVPVAPSTPVGTNSFCTTSWQSFPLWDLSFAKDESQTGEGDLVAFHGHPAHPLPSGKDTYAGVVVPTKDGGCVYQLLAPSGKHVEEAKLFHQQSCKAFLEWYGTHGTQ
mmetsp:Transcript_45930/g.69274  ORF Transcript_45930/g.69274 Transcript_45930/m.69274 type:complete len:624 (-) Transcript_45930:60-1931(-)